MLVNRKEHADQQWLLQIRDINLLCLLKIVEHNVRTKGMGGGFYGKYASIQLLLQGAESILRALSVEEAKFSLTEALKGLRQRLPDRKHKGEVAT